MLKSNPLKGVGWGVISSFRFHINLLVYTKKTKRNPYATKGRDIQGHRGHACHLLNRLTFFLEKTAHIIFINNISFLHIAIPEAMQKQEIVYKRDKNDKNNMDSIL